MKEFPSTLGALKRAGYRGKPVKEELRDNLLARVRGGGPLMPGVIGYEETVLRQLTHAILSKHDILLLGLRGQGKTRILRKLAEFLDERIPIVAGSEVNDDPFAPISRYAQELIAEQGDDTPIEWIGRERRYGEKLATPDVSMADLIGDIDPVKAFHRKIGYGHEGAIQFGIIPRTNRGIFVINELPDLQARIQVGLLNIMEERDIQIRSFRVRIPLDILMAFSANPEDYTNRGNIITPLKDRIDSQIITHYPKSAEAAMEITRQEAWLDRPAAAAKAVIPETVRLIVERIAFEAREDKDYVDQKSGVSARLPIAAMELLASAVELRGALTGEASPRARLSDLESVVPAITGKLELVYAGEQEGPANIARAMVGKAVRSVFHKHFQDPYNKKEKQPEANPYYPVVSWFEKGNHLTLGDRMTDAEYRKALESVPDIRKVLAQSALDVKGLEKDKAEDMLHMELLLEGLHLHSRLSKENLTEGFTYRDMMSDILKG
ncbi:MAG TPA: magnesium chelatase [Fibrobacteria bacterium]|nr:magnesium chelatase [Fibrobacteria bacterium]